MYTFIDKFQYKNHIGKIVADFGVSYEVYDKMFSKVFEELFEKEVECRCLENYYNVSLTNQIISELNNVKKTNKKNFLILFEDCQLLNNELNELVQRIKRICHCTNKLCNVEDHQKIDISKYLIFSAIVENKNLKVFKPELVTSPKFIEFFEQNIGKYGLYFLYNIDKELLMIGKSEDLGKSLLNIIYDRNIEGYVAVAYTKTLSDIYVYENYYIIIEQPLLNVKEMAVDGLSFKLKELKKSDLIKIYENN
jgi:hypothetical protein